MLVDLARVAQVSRRKSRILGIAAVLACRIQLRRFFSTMLALTTNSHNANQVGSGGMHQPCKGTALIWDTVILNVNGEIS